MLIVEEKEIFNSITKNIVASEIDDEWKSAILKIMVIGNTVDFNLNFCYENNLLKNTKLKNAFFCGIDVLKLHKLTNGNPSYKKWNKSEITLYSNSKFEIQYSWDDDLQNEIDRIKKEN